MQFNLQCLFRFIKFSQTCFLLFEDLLSTGHVWFVIHNISEIQMCYSRYILTFQGLSMIRLYVLMSRLSGNTQVPRYALFFDEVFFNHLHMKNVIPYVSTHNPKNPEIYNVIRNNLPILEEDPGMKKILDNSQNIKSKRRIPNLKTILTRASFPVKLKNYYQEMQQT